MPPPQAYIDNMESFEFGRLAYLVVLGLAIGGYLLIENRHALGRMLRQAMAWALIFVGVIAGYGLWNDIRDDIIPRQALVAGTGQVSVPRHFDGHFYLILHLNGQPVEFVVDTGATEIVLSKKDAAAIGINMAALVYSGLAQTANGQVRTAPIRVETIELEGILDRNVPVRVNDGEMQGSLLGMSYLRRFSRIEIADDKLLLTR